MKNFWTLVLAIALTAQLVGCGKEVPEVADEPANVTEAEDASTEASPSDVIMNTAEVTFPAESPERLAVETDAGVAVNYYIAARMYLDKFLQYDIESGNPEEYSKLLDDAINAFEAVEKLSAELESSAADLESYEAQVYGKIYAKERCVDEIDRFFSDPFLVPVYAAEESEAVKWAKDITERFDKAPAGKGIRTLAEQMGTDAKHAYAQLKQAQDILSGAAYDDFASTADTAYKTAMALKTAGSAAQLTLSIVTADPVTVTQAVMTSGGILINGMNTMLEIGQTGSVLIVGDDNKLSAKLENIENALAPIGATIGLYSLGSNLLKGKKILEDAPAMADSLMYMGTSLYDYVTDGKILGGTFTKNEDGTISATLSDTMTIKKQWAKDSKEVEEILTAVGYTKDEIAQIDETAQTAAEPYDQFANIPVEEISSILEQIAPVVSDTQVAEIEISDSSEDTNGSESENTTESSDSDSDAESADENTTEADSESEKSGDIPDISELAGEYDFYLYMTMGEQSGEGEVPQIIKLAGGSSLSMTDYTGYTLYGNYNSSTGVVVFNDPTGGPPIKVTFSRNGNGGIHAELRASGEGMSASGGVNKR